jgi:predicted MPP superfamily phosphohydrolase
VWPISWITDELYECSWGSYQKGDTHYYVSSGMGIWGGKFRIGTQSEYIVATIRTEK